MTRAGRKTWTRCGAGLLAALGLACSAQAAPALAGDLEVLAGPGFEVRYQNCDGTLPTVERLTLPRRLSSRYTGMRATVRAELADGKPVRIMLQEGDRQLFEAVHWHIERARFAAGHPECVVLRYAVTDTVPKAAEILDFRAWVDVSADPRGRIVAVSLAEDGLDGTVEAGILRQVSGWSLDPLVRDGHPVAFGTSLEVQVRMVPRGWTSYEMSTRLVRCGPRPVHVRLPPFPRRLASRALEGEVVVEFMVAGDGRPVDPRVVRSEPAGVFDREALRIIRGWRYKPDMAEGRPVLSGPVRQVVRFDPGMRPEALPGTARGARAGRDEAD